MEKNTKIKWAFAILFLAGSVMIAWARFSEENDDKKIAKNTTANKGKYKIDEKADEILRDMSDHLSRLDKFSFSSEGYYEVIIDSVVQKIQLTNKGKVFVQRPDKVKAERTGEKSDVEIFYNRNIFSIYGKNTNMYASTPIPENLDKGIDYLRENLDVHLPAGDLLYSDVYSALMEDVVAGMYVGQGMARNILCDHLAFSGNEVDWQIWVEAGPNKLPRRYVITSKKDEGSPEFAIEISDWNINPKFKADLFSFIPPKGAQKIDFLQIKDVQTKNLEKK